MDGLNPNPAASAPTSGFRAWVGRELRTYGKYLVVGGAAAVTDLTTYALLAHAADWHPLAANLVSRPAGGLVSFGLNKWWTFGNRGRASTPIQFARFGTVWIVCFLLSETLVGVYHQWLHAPAVVTKLLAEGTLGVFSFLAQRLWTFR